jgi:hypothetical protein
MEAISGHKTIQEIAADHAIHLGLPRSYGQVDRRHAMTLRLSIDDQPDQDQTPVYGAAET